MVYNKALSNSLRKPSCQVTAPKNGRKEKLPPLEPCASVKKKEITVAKISEHHNFSLLVLIFFFTQAPDYLFTPPDDPFWAEPLFNGMIDATAFLLVYFLIDTVRSVTAFGIMALQAFAVIVHFSRFFAHLVYNTFEYQLFADLCNIYTPALIAILCLKVLLLGSGGYGLYSRIRWNNYRRVDAPGVILSSDYVANRSKKEA